jgi:hypothetical protein
MQCQKVSPTSANCWAELTNLTSRRFWRWPEALVESVLLAVSYATLCTKGYCPNGHSKQLDHKHRKERTQKY